METKSLEISKNEKLGLENDNNIKPSNIEVDSENISTLIDNPTTPTIASNGSSSKS